MDILTSITILVLAAFVGFEVISKVPNTLHTPLMSGTNAIHGIVLLGGILVISSASGALNKVILFIAIVFGTINIVGGFLVTDRMLGMFKGRKKKPAIEEESRCPSCPPPSSRTTTSSAPPAGSRSSAASSACAGCPG